jgi:hypothetical protein
LPWVAAIGYLLDPRALEDVGIFRVPGSTKEVNELFVSLEARNNPDVIALKDCWDPNAVASLIKRMMLESNPRVPLSSAQAAQIARQWQSAPDDVHAVEALVAKLPDLNFSVLFSVFYLFDAVLREEKNRMDSNALGVSIGLSLFAGFSSNATVNGGLLGFLAHNRVQVHRCPAPLQSRQPQSRQPLASAPLHTCSTLPPTPDGARLWMYECDLHKCAMWLTATMSPRFCADLPKSRPH